MFISYKYINYKYDSLSLKYLYPYKIIDSDFTTQTTVAASAAIKAYESKNLDVISNLFLCNLYSYKTYGWEINDLLFWQKQYINKYYDVDFDKYYDDLVKYTKKMMVIS